MPGLEDEAEEGLVYLMWGELLEPKVVKPSEGGAEPEEHMQQEPQNSTESRQFAKMKDHELRQDGGQESVELDYGDDVYLEDNRTQEHAKESLQPSPQDDDDDLVEALKCFDREEGTHDADKDDEVLVVDKRVDEADDEMDSPPDSPPAEEEEVTHNLQVEASDKEMDSYPGEHMDEDQRVDEAEDSGPERGEAATFAPAVSGSSAVEIDFPILKTEEGVTPRLPAACLSSRAAGRGPTTHPACIVISDDDDSDPGPALTDLFSQESLFSSQSFRSTPKDHGPSTSVTGSLPRATAPLFPSDSPQRQLYTEALRTSPEKTPTERYPGRKLTVVTPPSPEPTRRVLRVPAPDAPTGSQPRLDSRTHGDSQSVPENSASSSKRFPSIPGNWAALRAANDKEE